MTAIAVTGAAGSVGRRVVDLLVDRPDVSSVTIIDRAPLVRSIGSAGGVGDPPTISRFRADIFSSDLPTMFAGCDTIVHLAEDSGRSAAESAAIEGLRRVLDGADAVDCGHVVLLSSALVYGAYADNPVPLTERHDRRPVGHLRYAVTKARLEELAERWAAKSGGSLAILRPTTTVSERGVSYIAGRLRSATSLRSEAIDPPVQFLHHDDLASAVSLAAADRLSSTYNVAPDGWIGPDLFRDLVVEAELRWPEPIDVAVSRASSLLRTRPEEGLTPYVTHPWVVANDRLRANGWTPQFTNEEAYVLGNPAPGWRTFVAKRRQELALTALGAVAAGAMGAAGLAAKRLLRPR